MAKILPWIILILFLAALVSSMIYLSRRFCWAFDLGSRVPLNILISAIPVFFIGGMFFINATGSLGHFIYKLAAILMGVYLFLVLSVLLVHLFTVFYKLNPLIYGIAALGLTLLVSVYGYWQSYHTRVTEIDIPVKNLNQELKVVENEVDILNGIQVVGLTHMNADRNSFDPHASEEKPTIEETLPTLRLKAELPLILLHHSPNGAEYASKAGIDVYLAGHTHAVQIFPFNIFANLMFPYNQGLHEFENMKVFVSEGIGTFGPPFRIGTKSEIVVINLKPE